jgi:hypothetical protein
LILIRNAERNNAPLSIMTLNDEQRKKVAEWIAAGAKLSEIQTRLASELGIRMTYMEVRFLVDDLKLTPKDVEQPKPSPVLAAPAAGSTRSAPPMPAGQETEAEAALPATGGVSLTVDQVTRPGAIVSGKVTFSDGQQADWYLDQMGRLGVVAQQKGYKPSAPDVQEFQMALQNELAKLGY